MNSLFVIAHATKEKRDHAVALVQECADHHANEVGDQRDQFGPIAKQIEGSKVGHNQGDDQQQAAIHDAGGNQVGSARLFGIGLPRMLASLEAYQVAGLRNSEAELVTDGTAVDDCIVITSQEKIQNIAH